MVWNGAGFTPRPKGNYPLSVIAVVAVIGAVFFGGMLLLNSCGVFDDSPKPSVSPSSSVSATTPSATSR